MISDGRNRVMGYISQSQQHLIDLKYIKKYSIVRIDRFITTVVDGVIRISIYGLAVMQSVVRAKIGQPIAIGIFFAECIKCHRRWRSCTGFVKCSRCDKPICNRCFRQHILIGDNATSRYTCRPCKSALRMWFLIDGLRKKKDKFIILFQL